MNGLVIVPQNTSPLSLLTIYLKGQVVKMARTCDPTIAIEDNTVKN